MGVQIAHLRIENKYTQEQLAEKLNVSPQAVSKWENGKADIAHQRDSFPKESLKKNKSSRNQIPRSKLTGHEFCLAQQSAIYL